MQKNSCGVCYLVGETEIPNNVVLIAVEEHRKNTVENKSPAFCMQGHKHHQQNTTNKVYDRQEQCSNCEINIVE